MARYILTNHRGERIERKTRTSAADRFYDLTYAAIRANAGLDTRWGYVAAQAALGVGDELRKGVAVGYRSSVDVIDDIVTVERIA